VPSIVFLCEINARDVPEVEISECRLRNADCGMHNGVLESWSIGVMGLSNAELLKIGVLDYGLFSECSFECCNVDVTGEMNWTLSVDRIPTRWVG
jgi:hypothetical protein